MERARADAQWVHLRVPVSLRRFYYRHETAVKIGAVVLPLAAMLTQVHDTVSHPTKESIVRHINDSAAVGELPELSDAELRELRAIAERQRREVPERAWADEEIYDGAAVRHLDRPGTLITTVSYSDGYFMVSDVHHLVTKHDVDPIDVIDKTASVAAGAPGQVMVSTCCEGNDTPVRLVLRRTAPPDRAPAGWAEATDVDLDLATGRLFFGSSSGTNDVVTVPRGRYRMRVTGRGAVEFEQARERFRIELWPRRVDTPMRILRTAHAR